VKDSLVGLSGRLYGEGVMRQLLALLPVIALCGCAPSASNLGDNIRSNPFTGQKNDLSLLLRANASINGKPVGIVASKNTFYTIETSEYMLLAGLDSNASNKYIGPKSFSINIKNKTNNLMKIVWDNSAISINGSSEIVFHDGVKYSDRSNSKPSTIVIPGGQHIDGIFPAGYTSFTGGIWYSSAFMTEIKATTNATLLLSLEVNGATQNLLLTYTSR
jgi:hypothetical protein